MPRKPAVDRQKQVLLFVWTFMKQHRVSPSYDDIVEGTGIKSKSHVQKIIRGMEANDLIAQVKGCSRSLYILPKGEQLCDPAVRAPNPPSPKRRQATYINQAAAIISDRIQRQFDLPILGRTFAGELTMMAGAASTAEDALDRLTVFEDSIPPKTKPADMFVLEVQGDSMIEAKINDGDYIIVQRAEKVDNGAMAVIWLDDTQETTLKYFYKENDGYRLQPANSSMQPILVGKEREIRIVGKVVSVVSSKYQPA